MIPTFYINLDRATARRAFMEQQFRQLSIEGTRIAALTPADIDPALIARHCDQAKIRHVLPNELAATMSHRLAWQRVVDGNLPWALILEDDAILSPKLPAVLALASESLPSLDIIRLETRETTVALDPPDGWLQESIALCRPVSHNPGAAGYCVSLQGARQLLAADCGIPADDIIYQADRRRQSQLRLRQTVPGLVMPTDSVRAFALPDVVLSTIGPGGHESREMARKAAIGRRSKVVFFFDRLKRVTRSKGRLTLSKWRGGTVGTIPFAK